MEGLEGLEGQINSLIYDYLVTVDENLAGEFREENDVKPLEQKSPKIKDMLSHFESTTKRKLNLEADTEIAAKKEKLELPENDMKTTETEKMEAEEIKVADDENETIENKILTEDQSIEIIGEIGEENTDTEEIRTSTPILDTTIENVNSEAAKRIDEDEPIEDNEALLKTEKEKVEKEREEFETESRDLMRNWTNVFLAEVGKLKKLMDKGEMWEKKEGEKIETRSWNQMKEISQGLRAIYGHANNGAGRDHQA